MTSNTNNNSGQSAQLYEVFLYKKKDIMAIHGDPILGVELRSNKTSTDISLGEIYNLLLYLEEDIITIRYYWLF
jgi:hypothetical protein